MVYKQLTFGQRCTIAAFKKAGYFQKDIAREVGVSESTISRELSAIRVGMEFIYQNKQLEFKS